MKVILKNNVPKLGTLGQVVEVSDGYARNFLFPRGLALLASDGNLAKIEETKKIQAKNLVKQTAEAKVIAEKIESISCTIRVKTGESDKLFGSVTNQDIVDAAKKEGLELDKKLIELEKPIKELGLYHVSVKLTGEIVPKLKVWVVKEEI